MFNFIYRNPLNSNTSKQMVFICIRISIGLFFLTTGYNKLFVETNQLIMLETIRSAGIPFPELMAPVVSAFEFIAGLFLVLGLLTQISAIILLFICITALITVGIYSIPQGIDLITWVSWFFYIHDLLYIFILLFIISNKPDCLTIDHKISKYRCENNALKPSS